MAKSRLFARKTREEHNSDLAVALHLYNLSMHHGKDLTKQYKERSFKNAEMYFTKALQSGNITKKETACAFDRLGVIYMYGLSGGRANYSFAKYAFDQAIKLGSKSAEKHTEELTKLIGVRPLTMGEILNIPGLW